MAPISKPEICEVCDNVSFLRCIECDTIYCSTICQIKDWEKHRIKHETNNIKKPNYSKKQPVEPKKPSKSVQDRLKTVLHDRPSKLNIAINNEQNNNSTQSIETKKLLSSSSENSTPQEEKDITLKNEPKLMIASTSLKYKTNFKPQILPPDGYSFVIVKQVDNENMIYHLLPHSLNSEFKEYKLNLHKTYNDAFIKPLDGKLLRKLLPPLFMAKIGNFWARCVSLTALDTDGNLTVMDIDVGKKAKMNIDKDEFKAANAREFETPAYCFKVKLTNTNEFTTSEIADEDQIQVKIMKTLENGVVEAEVLLLGSSDEDEDSLQDLKTSSCNTPIAAVSPQISFTPFVTLNIQAQSTAASVSKLSQSFASPKASAAIKPTALAPSRLSAPASISTQNSFAPTITRIAQPTASSVTPIKSQIKPSLPKESETKEERFLISMLKYKTFKDGKNKLTYKDGSKLNEGIIHACEALKDNDKFYDDMSVKIADFIANKYQDNNYKPVLHELILARFTDDLVYRAMCKSIDENKGGCSVVYIDYGTESFVEFENIWKMPKELMKNCISRNINMKLASGRSWSEVDVDATTEKFCEDIDFEVDLKFEGKKLFAFIADSLVEFK